MILGLLSLRCRTCGAPHSLAFLPSGDALGKIMARLRRSREVKHQTGRSRAAPLQGMVNST